jgi:hypothetical protein
MCNCNEADRPDAAAVPIAPIADPLAPAMRPSLVQAPLVQAEVPLAKTVTIVASDGIDASAAAADAAGARPVLREGCYAVTLQPVNGASSFGGTLRVDRSAPDGGTDNLIVSGDLYLIPPGGGPHDPLTPAVGANGPQPSRAAVASTPVVGKLLPRQRIPIFPRANYHSYLKVTSVSASPIPIGVRLEVDQFFYTHPAAGSFKGSFPTSASRKVSIQLVNSAPTLPLAGPRFEGTWVEAGVVKGRVTLQWVSKFFRTVTVELDTLAGAVAPAPVADGAGGTEYFDTIYAKHGWQLSVITNETDVPVPPGVSAADCWSAADLHALMSAHRNPSTDLDKEWRIHLMVVPAKLGCGRGVMYDQIAVPREGCASFSDDGYPTSDSANFGAAASQKQRDIPRAYLRSATHEITHTLNQIHQEQETAADNSIMTTTPSVADVLGGPASGAPGVFPDQINLAVNTNVRHHLNHMPDPVIRPGGWPFASWFGNSVPQAANHNQFDPAELDLAVTVPQGPVALGQPVEVSWSLANQTQGQLIVPNDLSLGALFTTITITDSSGTQRTFRPFVIACESAKLTVLDAGGSVSASHRVFWDSEGFAFPNPGGYRVSVAVTWSAGGIPVGIQKEAELFVEFPTSNADNEATGLVMAPEVGKWVALGGDAYHLTDAARRLAPLERGDGERPRLLAGFAGLLPNPERAAESPGGAKPAATRRRGKSR